MKSQTFYLFRHGQTYYSKNVIPYGENELTASILPEAKPVITKMALFLNELSIDYATRSEFIRCKETTDIIEENANLKFTPDPLLNEFTEKEFELFSKRMEILVEKLKNLKEERIVICTHGAVVAALQKLLLGKPFRAHDLMYYPKTGVIVKIEGEKKSEVDFN